MNQSRWIFFEIHLLEAKRLSHQLLTPQQSLFLSFQWLPPSRQRPPATSFHHSSSSIRESCVTVSGATISNSATSKAPSQPPPPTRSRTSPPGRAKCPPQSSHSAPISTTCQTRLQFPSSHRTSWRWSRRSLSHVSPLGRRRVPRAIRRRRASRRRLLPASSRSLQTLPSPTSPSAITAAK